MGRAILELQRRFKQEGIKLEDDKINAVYRKVSEKLSISAKIFAFAMGQIDSISTESTLSAIDENPRKRKLSVTKSNNPRKESDYDFRFEIALYMRLLMCLLFFFETMVTLYIFPVKYLDIR